MSDVKEMIVKGIIYSFKDAAARERITALQADVNRIYSDFAEYDKVDHPDIIFGTPTQTGAIVNGNGAVVPMEGYNISNPISVTKGLLYKLYIGVGATIPAGIAVFAIRKVSEDGRVVYTPAFVSNNTTKVSRLGYLVFFASENAEIVASYPASTNKLEVAEYGVLKSLATQIDNLRKEVDLKSFADGYYAQMSVGYARNLIMPNTPTENEFSHRQSGGGVIESGVSTYDKIMGRSLVWNNIAGLAHGSDSNANRYVCGNMIPIEHYTLICGTITTNALFWFSLWGTTNRKVQGNGTPIFHSDIIKRSDIATNAMIQTGSDTELTWDNLQVIDLTQMFGVGNEPLTYEEFLQRKPIVEDEFAYNEGEIINNKVEKIKSIGINLWDEEWVHGAYSTDNGGFYPYNDYLSNKNFIPIIGGKTYYIKSRGDAFYFWYDINKKYISGGLNQNTAPANARYLNFTDNNYSVDYEYDICINISEPAINGQYFPYKEYSLDLSWIKEIKDENGVPLFEDGLRGVDDTFDEAKAKEATKRMVVKVFDGTENWSEAMGVFFIERSSLEMAMPGSPEYPKILCADYQTYQELSDDDPLFVDKTIVGYLTGGFYQPIAVKDTSFASVSQWKQHLAERYAEGNPLKLIYKLAEPIKVEYPEKSMSLEVVAGGTETAIATEPSTPMRAMISYGIDAVATILSLVRRVTELEGKINNLKTN